MSNPLFADAKPAGQKAAVFASPAPDLSGFVQVSGVQDTTAVVVAPQVQRITVTDDMIDKLGEVSSSKVSQVSQKILAGTKASDVDVLGAKLNELVVTTKKLDPEKMGKPGLIGRIFGAADNLKEKLLSEYQTVETRMDTLCGELDSMRDLMVKRVGDLDKMFEENEQLYKQLENEIQQGYRMLESMKSELAAMPAPSNPLEAQHISDFQSRMDRLDKRCDDLKRGQQLILISLPEIRMEQDNKRALATSVNTIKVTTIPAWKGVFSRYILAMETKKGAQIVNGVYDATDEAFRNQADMMRQNANEVAKMQQRAVVSVETLVHCRDQLLGAIDDVKRIKDEGRAARATARPQIEQLEQSLISRFTPAQLTNN